MLVHEAINTPQHHSGAGEAVFSELSPGLQPKEPSSLRVYNKISELGEQRCVRGHC